MNIAGKRVLTTRPGHFIDPMRGFTEGQSSADWHRRRWPFESRSTISRYYIAHWLSIIRREIETDRWIMEELIHLSVYILRDQSVVRWT